MEQIELLKQVVRPRRMDSKNEEAPITWDDLRQFCFSLTSDQLQQPVKVWGEEKGGGVFAISIAEDEGINPSGEAIEPRRLYAEAEDEFSKEIANDEPTVLKKGTIILEGDF
jgi:hypothetical protein